MILAVANVYSTGMPWDVDEVYFAMVDSGDGQFSHFLYLPTTNCVLCACLYFTVLAKSLTFYYWLLVTWKNLARYLIRSHTFSLRKEGGGG